MDSFLDHLKDYGYWMYLAVAGYLGWNHKRLDLVIQEQVKTAQKVEDLKETLEHVRDGVDKLTDHLLTTKRS